MSQIPPQAAEPQLPLRYRYPLKLPPGTVRASLVLLMFVPLWVLLAVPQFLVPLPMALAVLLVAVLFAIALPAWHVGPLPGTTAPGPFRMSPYLLHILVLLVTVGLVAWRYHVDPDDLMRRLTPPPNSEKDLPFLVGSLWAGLLAGMGVSWLLGPWRQSYAFQDIQASVSLLAMLGLSVWLILQVLGSTRPEGLHLLEYECILLFLVAWYFGARLRS